MTNLLKYHTFIPYEDKENTIRLIDLLNSISSSNDPLSSNYTLEKFDLDNQLAITFGIQDEEIVLLSTLFKREIYGNKARTMNRVWKHETLRAPSFGKYIKDSDITSLSIVPIHIPIALQNNIDSIFISIEGGAYRYLRYLSDKLTHKTGYKWYSPKNPVDVTGTNCLQHVTYCHLNPTLARKASEQEEIFSVI